MKMRKTVKMLKKALKRLERGQEWGELDNLLYGKGDYRNGFKGRCSDKDSKKLDGYSSNADGDLH